MPRRKTEKGPGSRTPFITVNGTEDTSVSTKNEAKTEETDNETEETFNDLTVIKGY